MQIRSTVCSLTLLLLAGVSHAADSSWPAFAFNGYGTLGVTHSSEDEADFTNSFTQPNGAGFTRDFATGVDSRVGLQMTTNFTEKLSAVVQLVSEQQYDNSYMPSVEWANIKYDFTPDFSLRAGRIVLPSFLVSDYRKVGFAIPWVRPPLEVYGMAPVSNSDGIDASYRFRRGELTNTLQGFAGRKNVRIPAGGTWEARELAGVFDTLEFGNTLLRAGFIQSHLTADSINSLLDLFRQFGTQGALIADRYDVNDKPIDVWVLGGRYDPGEWFVMAEWTRTESPSFLGTDAGWYVSSGYRLKQFTPYVSFAQRDDRDSASHPALPVAFLPPSLQGFASVLNAQLDKLLLPNASSTWTIGTRWDFMDNFSFKVQLDHIVLDDNSRASLTKIQPGFNRGGDLDVVSATIDFVF